MLTFAPPPSSPGTRPGEYGKCSLGRRVSRPEHMLSDGGGCGARDDPAQLLSVATVCLTVRQCLFDRDRPRVAHAPLCLLAPTSAVDQSDGTVSRLSRARISFPVLKAGIALFESWTATPVRGLRPVRAARILAEKAPNPRSSTRSPRRKASTISSNIALTTFSISRSKRCGFCEEIRFMSSD